MPQSAAPQSAWPSPVERARIDVLGPTVDDETRCVHWHGATDVVAMRFACCDAYYPCFECHTEAAGHDAVRWPVARFDEPAVLCGVCRAELSAAEYQTVSAAPAPACPHCAALFNPGCSLHAHLYFDSSKSPL